MVDAVSSLACTEFMHDDWGVDVTVSASQKGLMLPQDWFQCSQRAGAGALQNESEPPLLLAVEAMASNNAKGYFPYTPSTNLLYGLDEALILFLAEGLDQVFARHSRLAAAALRQSVPGGWKMSA